MAELTPGHYAVKERWGLPEGEARCEALVTEYLETIARRCHQTGRCVIGHIKALALFAQGGYLRVSVISPTRPAVVESHLSQPCREFELILNVVVYGLKDDLLAQITRDTAAGLCQKYEGQMRIETI